MPINITQTEEKSLEYLRQWVSKYTGIYYSEEKKEILYHRLIQLCLKNNFKDLSHIVELLQSHSFEDIALKIAQSVSTTHSYFYREKEILEYFQNTILDSFNQNELRIWSAASSSGQEAYSLAMIISEKFGMEYLKNYSILGTDINPQVIKQAEIGIYAQDNFMELPLILQNKYTTPIGLGQHKIIDELKKICLFRRLNLNSENWPFTQKFHIVFCRNVLYYFEKQQQEEVLNNIYNQTIKDGYLITSVTESVKGLDTNWITIMPGVHKKI